MRGAGARRQRLLSDEHFTVDGTLLEAWASQKSFRRKDEPAPPPDDPGNPTVNFHGERRSNETHQSTTDPDAGCCGRRTATKRSWPISGNVLMENRHGLVVDATARDRPPATAERDAAIAHGRGLAAAAG